MPAHPLNGNIGFGLQDIETYLPLSANLLLAAWCPSIAGKHRESISEADRAIASVMLSPVAMNPDKPELKTATEKLRKARNDALNRISAIDSGTPVPLTDENMDFHNSMTLAFARRFIVCRDGDFDIAKRWMQDTAGHTGSMIKIS